MLSKLISKHDCQPRIWGARRKAPSGSENLEGYLALPSADSRHSYTQGEMTSQSQWSRYDRHFVGITRHNALS